MATCDIFCSCSKTYKSKPTFVIATSTNEQIKVQWCVLVQNCLPSIMHHQGPPLTSAELQLMSTA